LLLFFALQSGQPFDSDRKKQHPLSKGGQMLIGQNGRRAKNSYLLSIHSGLERRSHGDFCLPITNIAAQQPVHWLVSLHIASDFLNGPQLVFSFFVGKNLIKFSLPLTFWAEGKAPSSFPPGIKFEQLLGDFFGRLFHPGSGFHPALTAQFIQLRVGSSRTGKFLNEIQILNRNQ